MAQRKIFQVILADRSKIYSSGDTVTGKVIMDYPKERSIVKIIVSFVGAAKVAFTRGGGENSGNYHTKKYYFNYQITLLECSNENIRIPAGYKEYPFAVVLPVDLPSTTLLGSQNPHGKITYHIQAIMTNYNFSKTYSLRCYFRVNATVDLNTLPEIKNPISETETRVLKRSERTICTLNLAKGGFIPGELLLCNIDIDNLNSSKLIKRTTLDFVQRSTCIEKPKWIYFENDKHIKNSKRILFSLSGPSVRPGEKHSWVIDNIRLANDIAPTQTDSSHLVLVRYEIRIDIKPAGRDIFNIHVPIVIGTVPIRTTDLHRDILSQTPMNGRIGPSASTPSAPTYDEYYPESELPPPSYQEAIAISNHLSPGDMEQVLKIMDSDNF